jgi:2-polyprenyl-6-hydroxyphenyl methylase/3-demethylubiquinone-9 3-methyltransferase
MTRQENSAQPGAAQGASVDPREIANFARMAAEWWDPAGKFRPLHKMNPVRIGYVRDALCRHFGRDTAAPSPLADLRILDIGCGGGLLCEPLARLGAAIVGVDAAARNIGVARAHAAEMGLDIDYRHATAEALAEAGERFDAVVSLEVVEHVADVGAFLTACCRLVDPGGVLVLSTLNRTGRSFAIAIVGAEYVLRWLPRGTHDWKKFLRPSELVRGLAAGGVATIELTGVTLDPLSGDWRLAPRDLAINYMALGLKAAA